MRLEFGSFFDHLLAAGNGTFIDGKFSLFGFALFGKQISGIGISFRKQTQFMLQGIQLGAKRIIARADLGKVVDDLIHDLHARIVMRFFRRSHFLVLPVFQFGKDLVHACHERAVIETDHDAMGRFQIHFGKLGRPSPARRSVT